jgi:hypothetical protein
VRRESIVTGLKPLSPPRKRGSACVACGDSHARVVRLPTTEAQSHGDQRMVRFLCTSMPLWFVVRKINWTIASIAKG